MDETGYNPTREPVFTETMQIGIVVRDLSAGDANGLVDQSIEVLSQTLQQTASQRITDWGELKNAVRRDLSGFLSDRTGKRPIILPLIVEV